MNLRTTAIAKVTRAISDDASGFVAQYLSDERLEVGDLVFASATPTPVDHLAGGEKPFMYGIMEPDGTAYMDEVCVDLSPGPLEELIEESEMTGYTVVPLYLHPATQIEASGDDLRAACKGIADDYMTSENHHPGYVLIPTAKFEAIRAALETSPVQQMKPGSFGIEDSRLAFVRAQAEECEGADDPEERCPRHPKDCTCWQVDNDHPMRKGIPPVDQTAVEPGVVYVEVSGLTGSGKSAVMGEIEIALKAIGLAVEHDAEFQSEKNMSHADWQADLELYKPRVRLTERNVPRKVNTNA